jgi:hypothetical protein
VRNIIALSACLLGCALAACGGGGGASAIGKPPAGAPTTAPTGTATVGISIHFSTTSSTKRRAQYVGAGTKAITVAVNGASPAPYACAAPGCTVSVAAPLGSDTFAIDAYDGTPGASPAPLLISSGNASATILANASNAIDVEMGAVVASGALTLTVSNRLPLVGTPTTTVLNVTAGSLVDPDGNAIEAGSLLSPITFAPSPASTHITVSPSTVTNAATPVTIAYDGAPIAPVTIVATQTITGNVISSTSTPLQIVPHTYFVFIPSYKTSCPNTAADCLKIWSPILNTVVGTASVGNGASDITVNAGLTQAYVPNSADGTISVVDISNKESPQTTLTIPVLSSPAGIAYDTTHGRNVLYTASLTSTNPPSQLLSVAPTGGTVHSLEATHAYLGPAILDPTGDCLYSPTYGQNQQGNGDSTGFDTYDLINNVDRGYTSNFATSTVVVAPNGATVYALTVAGGTPAYVTAFPVTNPGCTVGSGVSAGQPGVINGSALTMSRDGSTLYVGGKGGNPALTTFSTSPFAITNNYIIGSGLAIFELALSPDNRYLYTTDNYGGTSTASFHIIDMQAQGGPAEIAGSPFLSNVNIIRAYP